MWRWRRWCGLRSGCSPIGCSRLRTIVVGRVVGLVVVVVVGYFVLRARGRGYWGRVLRLGRLAACLRIPWLVFPDSRAQGLRLRIRRLRGRGRMRLLLGIVWLVGRLG